MKLSRLIVWVTFLAILAMATHVSIDSDTWWHLKAGEWMVENQQMITEDPFSLTRQGTPWQYPGLWVQVFLYGIYALFGPGGVNLWVSLMVVLIFWLVWQTTTGNPLVRALVIILAAASSAIYWAARPYLFTYLFGALFFLLLRQYRQGERKTLFLPPLLMVLWVNSHGGFLAGFLFVGPFFVEAGVKRWAVVKGAEDGSGLAEKRQFFHLGIVLVLLFIATILNPQGITLWELPFTTVSRQAEQLFIAEWQSPDFHVQTLLPFGLLLILTIAVLGGSEKKASLSDILLLSGFGLLSLLSVRNIFFYVIVAPSVLTAHISGILSKWQGKFNLKVSVDFESPPTRIQKIMNVTLVVVVGIVALFRVLLYMPSETNIEEFAMQYPVSAVEFLQEEQPEGNLFNSYNFGGYLIWALPEYPVFVDGRADLHQDEIILTWYSAYNGSEGWQEVFDEWDIGFVVVEPTAPLIKDLKWANWDLLYADEVAVVYTRPAE